MQTLDAVLAFAITMLILSMVVTTLVESLHRGLRLREKGLQLMLARFYDRVISRRNAGPPDSGMRAAFIQTMTANRAPAGKSPLRWIWAGRQLGELGVQGFMERLGSTPYAANIVTAAAAEGDQALAAAIKDISQKFEAFGREASTYFEARARLLSVVIGVVLAFVANVNAFDLFATFMRNPDVTREVIALEKTASAEYRKQYEAGLKAQQDATAPAVVAPGVSSPLPKDAKPAETGQKTDDKQKTAKADAPKRATTPVDTQQKKDGDTKKTVPTDGPQDAKPPSGAQNTADDPKKAAEQVKSKYDDAIRELKGVGVPIGWKDDIGGSIRASAFNGDAVGLFLGGLLVGLGAPFWYRAVNGLMSIRTLLGGRGTGSSTAGAGVPVASRDERAVAQPQTPVEAFKAARAAADANTPLRPPEEPVG